MQSDDDLQTTLSKWPFILGDVLLVATALTIAILADWQLDSLGIAFCIAAVALGCSLFALPYIVEFQVRVREEREDRTADLRILQRHLVSAQDQLEAVSDRIEAVEAGLTNVAHAEPDLSEPLQALEGQIDPLRSAQNEQSKQLAALAQQADALAQQVLALTESLKSTTEADAIESLRSDLAALQATVAELPAQVVDAPKEEVAAEEPTPEPKAKKTREPRKRRTPEPRLLQRAIDQKQDRSSAAVSRIIESKTKKDTKPEAEKLPDAPQADPEPESNIEESPAPEPEPEVVKPAEPEPIAEEPEVKDAPEPEPRESKPEPEPKPKSKKPEPATEPEATAEAPERESTSESTLAEPDDMFADAVPPQVQKRTRTKKSDTAVIASVFIGIGNKPFVRGSGAGLNWELGVEMEFEEIGKWRWIAPADLEAPVEIQLYRNDEDPDSTGKYTLEPGQQLDLSPVF